MNVIADALASAAVESQAGASTQTVASAQAPVPQPDTPAGVLHLTLAPKRRKKSLKWSQDTVDNENLGKRKSKKCCIFHARRQFGDWSDDNDSDCECQNT